MGKHSKKRARKKARAIAVTHRAAALAQKARREAEVAVARANMAEASYCPLTDIEKLNATVDDVLKTGISDEPLGWYAVRCAPTAEKRVLASLRERRVAAYLPCEKVWARHQTRDGKRVMIERPLLVGYLFVALPGEMGSRDFAGVRKVSGVESFVGIGGEPRAIPEREISALRLMDRRGDFDMTASPFTAKQQLKIVQGIFAGLIGEVVAMKGDDVVRLMLGYKIVKGEHDFPAEHLVPADPVKAA